MPTDSRLFTGIRAGSPALILAPMEGVTDAPMRALMTERGGFSLCVSEFLRVSHEPLPGKVLRRQVPELLAGSRTASGVPVQVQLLGGNPERLAETAARAVALGAWGIDLNFGCPAPTVNRHDGGATLLKFPSRIRDIVEAVRRRVPPAIPVSAKLRLGWDSPDPIHANAEMAAQGGASWLTIHGRTKAQGYAPPALWLPIGEVRRRLGIPVVANGDIWNVEDFLRCREETGSEHFMLGRGALADPRLPLRINEILGTGGEAPASSTGVMASADWLVVLERFHHLMAPYPGKPGYATRRIKQWLRMASLRRGVQGFDQLKRTESVEEIFTWLAGKAKESVSQARA